MTMAMSVLPFDPRSFMPPILKSWSPDRPVLEAARRRNVVLDQRFYDVGALTQTEVDWLVQERNIEGSVLIVFPRGARGDMGVHKYPDYAALRAAPGALLTRFSVAGVGSSDLGAAALARNLADHCGEPVGAVVAGYGFADVISEGIGGWFVLGAANRMLSLLHDVGDAWMTDGRAKGTEAAVRSAQDASARSIAGPDSDTLLSLLRDDDRRSTILLGHSKGCLSIAAALFRLAATGPSAALDRAREVRVVTTGAVVEFPRSFDKVAQFLGGLDWFGAMNSRLDRDYVPIPNAWHHLNTAVPMHMDVKDVLARADALFVEPQVDLFDQLRPVLLDHVPLDFERRCELAFFHRQVAWQDPKRPNGLDA